MNVEWICLSSFQTYFLSRKSTHRNINTCPQNSFDVQRHQSVASFDMRNSEANKNTFKVKDDLTSLFGVFSMLYRSQPTSLWTYSTVLHQRLQRRHGRYEEFREQGYKERNKVKICRMAVRQVRPDSEMESWCVFAPPCHALIEPDS